MPARLAFAFLVALAASSTALVAKAEEPFESYPHIRCEACLTITQVIGVKMNETSKVKTSIQSSHRMEVGNERRQDYESSELRAVEILDKLCDNSFFNKYFLRYNATSNKRYFSDDKTLKRAPFYGQADKAILGAPSRKLMQYCLQLMDESDMVFTKAIMKERTLDALQQNICHDKLKICSNTKAMEKSLAKEDKLRKKHMVYKEKRRMKKLHEEKKRLDAEDAAEAARKAAEEAAAAAEVKVGGGETVVEEAPAVAGEAEEAPSTAGGVAAPTSEEL